MEEVSSSSLSFMKRTVHIASIVEAMAVDTLLAAGKSLLCLLILTGSVLTDINHSELLKLTTMDGRFPLDELSKGKPAYLKNKDASDSEEDEDEEDDDDANDQDDEEGDNDFSGEEGEEEADPEANGAGGSDGDDDDDDDGDEEDDGDDDGEDEDEEEEEEEEEEDEEEVPLPPAKKRK